MTSSASSSGNVVGNAGAGAVDAEVAGVTEVAATPGAPGASATPATPDAPIASATPATPGAPSASATPSAAATSGASDLLAGSALAGGGKARRGKGERATRKRERPAAPAGTGKRAGGMGRLARHDFAVALRQLVPFLLVAVGVFAVAMPVSTAAIPTESIFNLDYTHDQMKFRFWLDDLTLPIVAACAAYGLVLGVRAFRFLLVRPETTAVLSLPLPRATLFATRFAACLLAIAVGIGVPLAASLAVNIAALDVWNGLFEQFAFVCCGLVLTAAVACAVASAACLVAGTMAEALAFAAALLGSVSVAAWAANAVMDWMLVGNAAGEHLINGAAEIAPSLMQALSVANPLLFFATPAADHHVFMVQHPVYYPVAGDWPLLGLWLVVLALLCAACIALIRRRPGERAGIAGLSGVLAAVVCAVVGCAAFGCTFTLLASLDVTSACAAAFLAFWVVSFALFRGPLKGKAPLRRTLGLVGGESIVLAALLACVGTGGLGFAQFVPATDDVKSVSVSYVGAPDYLAVGFDAASVSSHAYYFSATYSFDDAEAIDIVRAAHAELAELGHAPLAADRFDFAGTCMPYDVVIRYEMADGSQVVRYYDRAQYRQLAQIAALDGTQRVRDLQRAAITGDASDISAADTDALGSSSARLAYAFGGIYVCDALYSNPMLLNCDATARSELLEALAQDVAAQDVEDRYHPAGPCRGVLMFTQQGDAAAESFGYSLDNTVVYLTDSFERTLARMDSHDLSQYLKVAGDAPVSQMTVQEFSPYAGMTAPTDPQSALFKGYKSQDGANFATLQDFGAKFTTVDAAEIAELLPLCRNQYFVDGGGYLVSAKLADRDEYAYLFIPAAAAPEWLVRVAQE